MNTYCDRGYQHTKRPSRQVAQVQAHHGAVHANAARLLDGANKLKSGPSCWLLSFTKVGLVLQKSRDTQDFDEVQFEWPPIQMVTLRLH